MQVSSIFQKCFLAILAGLPRRNSEEPKIYYHDLNPGHFLDPGIESNYPEKDYHRRYVGETISVR